MTDSQDFVNVDPGDVKPAIEPKASQPVLSTSEENTLAMIAHLAILLNLVTGVLGLVVALVIYLAYKDRSRYVAYQSLQAIISSWCSSSVLPSWLVLSLSSPRHWFSSVSVFLVWSWHSSWHWCR